MTLGIYIIKNTINKKFYIGSSENVYRRLQNHKSALKRQKHDNQLLQRNWDKYGINCFEFLLLEKIEKLKDLLPREQGWLNKFWDGQKQCLNISKVANSVMSGRHHTNETKQKISKAMIDKRNQAVVAFSKDGKIQLFKSIKEASEKTQIKRTAISECLSGRNKTAGKLQWKYRGTN